RSQRPPARQKARTPWSSFSFRFYCSPSTSLRGTLFGSKIAIHFDRERNACDRGAPASPPLTFHFLIDQVDRSDDYKLFVVLDVVEEAPDFVVLTKHGKSHRAAGENVEQFSGLLRFPGFTGLCVGRLVALRPIQINIDSARELERVLLNQGIDLIEESLVPS